MEDNNITPDEETYSLILETLCRLNNVTLATNLLERMAKLNVPVTPKHLIPVGLAYVRLGKYVQATNIVEEITSKGGNAHRIEYLIAAHSATSKEHVIS
jgi:pentatricopeptide repeat protein